jgi:uncharacterized protein YcfJ
MATKKPNAKRNENLPVSKQTAGGVAGAVVGSAIAGPVGAVVGAVAGTVMGTRAAKGKSLVAPQTVKSVKDAAAVLKKKADSVIPNMAASSPKAKRTQGSSPTKSVSQKKAERTAKERPKTKSTRKKAAKRIGRS